MKTLFLLLLALLPAGVLVGAYVMGADGPVFTHPIPSEYQSKQVDWERHQCAICGKTVWEKVEVSNDVTYQDSMGLSGFYTPTTDLRFSPARVEAEHLEFSIDLKVCPYCLSRYSGATFGFQGALKKAADKFIADAKVKESKRRAEVSQENTQEELLWVEDQLRQYTEQVKKLTERLEALKKAIE